MEQIDGRGLLAHIKGFAGTPGESFRIPVGHPPRAYLRPVATSPEHVDARDAELLTAWRNRFVEALLTQFEATLERTARWLVDSVGPNDGKVLFMVEDTGGSAFGQMGLDFIDWDNGYGEVDAVIRGEKSVPGLMTLALQAMINWGRAELGLSRFGVKVLSDNPALNFYRKAGFHEENRVPLLKIEEGETTRLVEDQTLKPGGQCLVHMKYM